MTEYWACGAKACWDDPGKGIIQGGEAEKRDHLRTKHPGLCGMLFLPYKGDTGRPLDQGVMPS